jgi:hypothetical protein
MMVKEDMYCTCRSPFTTRAQSQPHHSTELDAEKRLALQEEKQALEAKLLEVYVSTICLCSACHQAGKTGGSVCADKSFFFPIQ